MDVLLHQGLQPCRHEGPRRAQPGRVLPHRQRCRPVIAHTTDPVAGERTRSGDTVLQEYSGKLPKADITRLFGLGEGGDTFDVTYAIEPESGELRTVKISGDFYKESPTTFTLKLKDYGKSVTIDKPAT
uniref:LppX_LprAFG lipoprotein n=1 Tax=Janibacter limosus TaxID=53458 RepID=A0AC61U347_9MICO|nr:LppX_LprAFG lipoprotein [Janibacter limosus]